MMFVKAKIRTCPICKSRMRWHDKRGGAQRAMCVPCDRTDTGRPESLRGLKLGNGTPKRVAELVVKGLPETAITERLKMSVAGAKRQIDEIVSQAEKRHDQAKPSVGSDWFAITTPSGYVVAVGKQARGWRVIDWVPPGNPVPLDVVVDSSPTMLPAPNGMVVWLAGMLAPAGQDSEAIERRLWIAMAYTNRWLEG